MKRTNGINGGASYYDRIECTEDETDVALHRAESVRRPGRISHVAIVVDGRLTEKVEPAR